MFFTIHNFVMTEAPETSGPERIDAAGTQGGVEGGRLSRHRVTR